MSAFDLGHAQERAQARLGRVSATGRRVRSDRGNLRIDARVVRRIEQLLLGHERPPMTWLTREIVAVCAREGWSTPSRATIYKILARAEGHGYAIERLPAAVRRCLYNLPETGVIPGRQLAFYCFNYGDLEAVTFAATLPWLDLYQAAQVRGWRPRSRGLLRAVRRVRRT